MENAGFKQTSAYEAAKGYQLRGFVPIPLWPNMKKPLHSGWISYEPTDEALRKDFGNGPANIGVLLGERSGGLVDVDIDSPVARMLSRAFLPTTDCVSGRASARHSHYFYVADPIPETFKLCDPVTGDSLVEVRASRHQTMVPPSVHPTGEVVEFESSGDPAKVQSTELVESARRLGTVALLASHWPQKGLRHDAALAVSGMLGRGGWDIEEVVEFIGEVARAAGDEESADRESCARTTILRIRKGGHVVGAPTLARIFDEGVVRTAAKWLDLDWEARPASSLPASPSQSDRTYDGFNFISIGDLLKEEPEETEWLVEGRLPSGGTSLVVAKPKVGKSTLVRALALAVARGEPWLGWETIQGPVIYLALEEKKNEVLEHFRAMGATGDEPLFIHFGSAPRDAVALLEEAAEKHQPVLIIIDTLQLLVRAKDLNDYAQVSIALEPLQQIARRSGAHLLFVHHARKGKLNPDGDSVLGSTAILGGVDTGITLRKADRCRSLWTTQRYGEDLEETVFVLDGDTRVPRLQGTRRAFEGGRVADEILSALRGASGPVTRDELEDRVSGRTAYKRSALSKLVEAGHVHRSGKGAKGDPYRYNLPASGPAGIADSDSCSLVPIKVREQETRNGDPPPLGSPPRDSCSVVPLPVGEQGNNKQPKADSAPVGELGTAPKPSGDSLE
jgi:hypothetical protein